MNPVDAPASPPVHKSAQRMRWFLSVFAEQAERVTADTGIRFDIDQGKLADVFSGWLKAFVAQKPVRMEDKEAYVGFAAGLMLRELIGHSPATVSVAPPEVDNNNPAYYWPQGYLYVAFCLNVRGLVIEQDFHGSQHVSVSLGDMRTWWSFKENVGEDLGLAIAFLDLFAGDEPNWTMPDVFQSGRAKELAGRINPEMIGRDT